MTDLKEKVNFIPNLPGIYLFLNAQKEVIYVGKAKILKKRVSQYFGQDNRPQIPFLISEAEDIDFVVASSELESLFLENTYIKKFLPKYNIKLRDDKNYAFIKIDYSTQIPQIGYARKLEKGGKNKFFGPFSSTVKIRKTLEFVRRVFPYCANSQIGKRPCFYYFLHRCPGVCAGDISLEEYNKHLERIEWFLNGKNSEIRNNLKKEMRQASLKRQYEKAAKLRDQLNNLDILEEKQVAQFPKKVDWDFISNYLEGNNACVNVFKIREGKLVDKENFVFSGFGLNARSVLEKFVENYYAETSDLPKEIFIEHLVESEFIQEVFASRGRAKIKILVPAKGKKLELINLGKVNAKEFLMKWENSNAENQDKLKQALTELQEILKLPNIPLRIEGYDISNIQGTNPVGSMVVMKNGLPAKGEYRKFKIKIKQTPDDFAMMSEMLGRRFKRMDEEEKSWGIPDLMVIDGGKGQLGAVLKAKEKYDKTSGKESRKIPIIGLAKRIEEIFLPGCSEPIVLSLDTPALQVLQRLRDEAHRFAITFHRSLRSKAAIVSELDKISGIGPKTKKLLKTRFGSVKNIRETSFDELAKVVGEKLAKKIQEELT